jgi:hypothetical protein
MQLQNLHDQYANDALKLLIINIAVNYCGAHPDFTSTDAWKECAIHLHRFCKELIPDEVTEAFRLAVAKKWPGIDLAAYRGQFNVKILGEVMDAYLKERNLIKVGVIKGLEEITESARIEEEQRKNAAASEQFYSEFKDLLASGKVPELDGIRFFWFEALQARSVFAGLDVELKRQLWTEALDLVKAEKIAERTNRVIAASIDRTFAEIAKTKVIPESWAAKRLSIYKKLLIRQVLMNNAMENFSEELTSTDRENDLPF